MNFLANEEIREVMLENIGEAIINMNMKNDDQRFILLAENVIEIFHKMHK